jgi:hypothetical protein
VLIASELELVRQFGGQGWRLGAYAITADRASHLLTGRTEVSFRFKVAGDRFSGTETVHSNDEHGNLTATFEGHSAMVGTRVKLP